LTAGLNLFKGDRQTQKTKEVKQAVEDSVRSSRALLRKANEHSVSAKRVKELKEEIVFQETLLESNQISTRQIHELDNYLIQLQKSQSVLQNRTATLTRYKKQQARELLQRMGVDLVYSKHEGEALCSALVARGYAFATVSEDLDACAFGEGLLLRGVSYHPWVPVLEIDPCRAAKELNLTRAQFIDMCILCGTDFGGTLNGVGPVG
jgi:5'-3' exonuclease